MPRSVRAPLFAAFACAAALVPVAVAAYASGPFQRLDLRAFFDLRRSGGHGFELATAFVNLGNLGPLLIMLGLVCALGIMLGRRRETLAAVVVIAGANLTTQVLKSTLEHARHHAIERGLDLPWPDSFPSGHTTAAASIAAGLLLVTPAAYRAVAAIVGLALVAAVGTSVVVLSWHYPSDVLGGLLVVGAWSFAVLAWLRLQGRRDAEPRTDERRRPRGLAVSTD